MNRRMSLLIGGGCLLLVLLLLIPVGLIGYLVTRPGPAPRALETAVSSSPLSQPPQQVVNPPLQMTQSLPGTGNSAGQTTSAPPNAPNSLTQLYQQVSPGVVSILAQVTQEGQSGAAAGSGFIIDNQGYIATNHHVVAGADQVFVSFYNGIQARAQVVGSDPDSDIAVLRVEQLPEGAHALTLGDSEKVQVGEWVVAIGNPFNIGSSMSLGIVSAVGRIIPAAPRDNSGVAQFSIPKAIQTDAAINPGNSGGPLINMNGEVVGIDAQIESTTGANTGVGFAIPANILKLVAPALIEKGSYQWPWLGVTGTNLNPSIVEANKLSVQLGAYIVSVVSGSPADKAGLQGASQQDQSNQQGLIIPAGGDVVIEADGQKITSYDQLLTLIAFKRPGDKIDLVILRNGKQVSVTATLEPRPTNLPLQP